MKKFIIISLSIFAVLATTIILLTVYEFLGLKDSGSMFIGLLTCLSTSLLGGVAYYQTKNAHKLTSLLSRAQLICFIKFDSSLDFNGCEFAIKENWENTYDGAIFENDKIELELVKKYLKFALKFKVDGAPLNSLYIKSFSIGTDHKQFDYTIKNECGKVGCRYSPDKKEYFLDLYVQFTDDFEKDCSESIRLDLNYISQSIYNSTENVKLSFYGIPKPHYDKSVHNYTIDNMTIHERKTYID